jgi:RNA-directed DNA polymerase
VQVSYSEGLADHIGPESCVVDGDVQGEALTGERAGWVLSRESLLVQGADDVALSEGNTGGCVMRAAARPCVVEDPSMRGRSLCGNREVSALTAAPVVLRPASGRPEGRSR